MTPGESTALLLAANGLRDTASAAERVRALSAEQVSVLSANGVDVPAAFQEALEAQAGVVAGLVEAANALEQCARCDQEPNY